MAAADKATLETLHELTARHLVDRMRSGEATAAEVTAALKMLKDNHIEALPTEDNPIGRLAATLPFQSAEDLADDTHH